MNKLVTTLCLIVSLALGNLGMGWSADFQKGMEAYKKGDFANAIKEWILLGEDGDEKAQYFLGLIYYKGKGVPQDFQVTGQLLFKLAAKQGNIGAQKHLGRMYDDGDGVPKDYKKAAQLFRLAAEQ